MLSTGTEQFSDLQNMGLVEKTEKIPEIFHNRILLNWIVYSIIWRLLFSYTSTMIQNLLYIKQKQNKQISVYIYCDHIIYLFCATTEKHSI